MDTILIFKCIRIIPVIIFETDEFLGVEPSTTLEFGVLEQRFIWCGDGVGNDVLTWHACGV